MHHSTQLINSPTSGSPKVLEDSMNNVIKSTEDIINDDFEKLKISDYPFQDYSWSPNYGTSPAHMTSRQERKPFTPLNQYTGLAHPNSQPIFPQSSSFSHGPVCFTPNSDRFQNKPIDNPSDNYMENKIRMSITEAMKQQGNNMPNPPLRLTVAGSADYELDEKDVVNLFARFGKIIRILVKKHRTAYILFEDPISALAGQKALNKCFIKNMNITLYVNFCQDFEEDGPNFDDRMNQNIQNFSKMYNQQLNNSPTKENNYMPKNVKKSVYTFDQNLSFLPNTTTKLTCKYDVQIDNEKEFRVAQKIIGSRGYNMKRIIEICQNHMKSQNLAYKTDFLKLRLRGKGSGFKEGPDQRESEEPIHLCVSSRYTEVFELACKMVEDLLNYVYREYETFCRATGRRGNFPMQLKKTESYSTPNERQTPEKYPDMMYNSAPELKDYPMYNNSNGAFYGHNNENFYLNNAMMSPSNQNFDPEMFYRQFGQDRSVNCFGETKVRQSSNKVNEVMAPYTKYN